MAAETSRKSGALIYPEPLGPPRPVAGDIYCTLLGSYVLLSIGKSANHDLHLLLLSTYDQIPEFHNFLAELKV